MQIGSDEADELSRVSRRASIIPIVGQLSHGCIWDVWLDEDMHWQVCLTE